MPLRSTVSSKGQVTIPQEIRTRLGLREGDRVEFVIEGEQTILRPARGHVNAFQKYVGALPWLKDREEVNAWIANVRGDDQGDNGTDE